MKLYKFELDCGRQGSLESLFLSDEETVRNSFGAEVQLGEVLGKHSDVFFQLQPSMIREINIGADACQKLFDEMGSLISGHDIIGSIEDD